MDIKKIVNNAREKKIKDDQIAFRLPNRSKEDFEKWCKKNGVTVSEVMNSFVEECLKHGRVEK